MSPQLSSRALVVYDPYLAADLVIRILGHALRHLDLDPRLIRSILLLTIVHPGYRGFQSRLSNSPKPDIPLTEEGYPTLTTPIGACARHYSTLRLRSYPTSRNIRKSLIFSQLASKLN